MTPARVAAICARHGVKPEQLRNAARGKMPLRKRIIAARVEIMGQVSPAEAAEIFGIRREDVVRIAKIYRVDLSRHLPVVQHVAAQGHMLPKRGPREDPRGPCARESACLDAHVFAHPTVHPVTRRPLHEVPASCQPDCRWWRPAQIDVEVYEAYARTGASVGGE